MEALLHFLKCKFWSDCAKYVMNDCVSDCECAGCMKVHIVTSEIPIVEEEEEETTVEIDNCCLFSHKE